MREELDIGASIGVPFYDCGRKVIEDYTDTSDNKTLITESTMKYIGVLVIILLTAICANSQVYGFKKDWTPASDVSKATYIMYLTKEDDTTYLCKYYNKYGVAINYETYKDSSLTIPNH